MKVWMLVAALSLAPSPQAINLTGTWEWQGPAGWQRILLTLKEENSRLSGVIRMGPGSEEPAKPADFWEYFFDPVDFRISNGTVSGNTITFEQIVWRRSQSLRTSIWSVGPPSASGPVSETTFVYRGVVQFDQIVMTREVRSDKKDPWSLGVHKVQFVLKRVK